MPRILLFLLFSSFTGLHAQPRFEKEIREFKKQDSIKAPPAGAILFVGSSSFRLWKDIDHYFPGYTIINRGFGGAALTDVIYYADDIILTYRPKQIVIYCGENDLTEANVTAHTVFGRFKALFGIIRNRLPDVSVVYVSIKPSPSRAHLMPSVEEANALIKKFVKAQSRASFVDVYPKMLNKQKSPREELFVDDKLHMNADGYAIWRKAIRPHLLN